MTSLRTITLSPTGTVESVTITEEIIGVITPQTVTLTYEVLDSNCTVLEPTEFVLGYNTTEFILPDNNLNSSAIFSIVSTVTNFTQMPTPSVTTYTTTTVSGNVETAYTTITTGNNTIISSTFSCPTMLA